MLLGNPRVMAECGTAQYTDLRIETMGTFQLQFRALILSAISANNSVSIGVIHGAAYRLSIIMEPRSVQIRLPFRIPPSLQILDAAGNVVETGADSELIIVAFVSSSTQLPNQPEVQTYPANETRKAAYRGTVKMSNIMLDSEGTDVLLRFQAERPGSHYSQSTVIGATAAPFVASDVPYALKIMVNISSVTGAREPFAVQPVVRLETVNGTVFTFVPPGRSIVVVASLDTTDAVSEQSLVGARLLGDKAVEAQLGVATFTNLQVDVMAVGYKVTFTVRSEESYIAATSDVTSAPFQVSVGSPARLRILRQPGGASPGKPMSVAPIVSVDDLGGNPVPNTFNISAELLQNGNVSQQHTVRTGAQTLAIAGIATFSNLTLTLAGDSFSLRFQLLQDDGVPWPNVEPIFSYPAFRVFPGAPFALNVDRQPSGAVTWGDLSLPPLVSVHDRGGNQVPEGPHYLFAALILPGSVASSDRVRFNISRPNPSPPSPPSTNAAASQPVWNMWIDTTNTSVLAGATGQASFAGLRIFGPRASRGLVIRFRHCWKNAGGLCSTQLSVDSDPFDLAGLPARLVLEPPAELPESSLTLTPDQWPEHAVLSSMTVALVDSSDILVQRPLLPGPKSALASPQGQEAQTTWANMTVSLCFLTDSAAQEFYCRGEVRDDLLYVGGTSNDGTIEQACAMGPDIFVPLMLGMSSESIVGGRATLRGMKVVTAGIYKFRFRAVAPSLVAIPHVDSQPFEVTVGLVAKLVEVRQVSGLRPGHAAQVQPVVAVTDSADNHVIGACDEEGRDSISVHLIIPERAPRDAGVWTQQWLVQKLSPSASLRYCVAEFVGLQVDQAGMGLRLNYSFAPYIKPEKAVAAAYIPPTEQELAEKAAAAAKLATVVDLWTISKAFNIEIGPLAVLTEEQKPVGCLAGVRCDIQPVIVLADAGSNQVTNFQGKIVVAQAVTASGSMLGQSFRAIVDAIGRASFTDISVASPRSSIRFNFTLPGFPTLGFLGQEIQVSGPAAAIQLVVQPSRASPGLVLAQQPQLSLVDKEGIQVTSHAPAAFLPVPLQTGGASGSSDVVAVEAVAYTTRAATGETQILQLPLAGKSVLVVDRGIAKFTDIDLSFVGTCLQMNFFVQRFASAQAAQEYADSRTTMGASSFSTVLQRPFSTTSAKLEVVIGAPHHLVPHTQPLNAKAGAIFDMQPRIAVHDAGGNLVQLDAGSPVTALLTNGATSLLQGGAGKIVASKGGIISYTNLRLDLAGTCWVLTFKRPGVFPCSTKPLVVTPGAAYKLHLEKQPAGASPGAELEWQPQIKIIDAYENVLWDTPLQVTANLLLNGLALPAASGTHSFPQPYRGESRGKGLIGAIALGLDSDETQIAVCEAKQSSCQAPKARAIISFTNLRIDARDRSRGYSMLFTCANVRSVTSDLFHVETGAGRRLVVIVQPEGFKAGWNSGLVFKIQPLVAVHDLGGNIAAVNVTVSVQLRPVLAALGDATLLLTGTHRLFTTSLLSGTHELDPAAGTEVIRSVDGGTGSAEYTDLGLKSYTSSTASGLILEFVASCSPTVHCQYLSVRSREFTSGGAPMAVAHLTSPFAPSVAGSILSVQPRVLIQDESRVTVEYWDGMGAQYAEASVSLSTTSGADGRTATLLGNTAAVYRLGVAQWTDLRIDVTSEASADAFTPPPGYFLTFSLRGKEWTEGGLVVSHAQPDRYLIWVQPGSGVGGGALSPLPVDPSALHQGAGPVVAVVDRFGNRAESISGGVIRATLVNTSAVPLSQYPGPVETVGTTEIALLNGIANFALSGIGAKVAASDLQLNFSGHGVEAVPGVSAGWTFTASAESSAADASSQGMAWRTEVRWVLSEPFVVNPGKVVRLSAFQEPDVFVASNRLNTQPIIHLLDAGSNAVKGASWQTVTVGLVSADGSVTSLGSTVASLGIAAFQGIGMPSQPVASARLLYSCDPCEQGDAAITIRSASFDVAEFSGAKRISIAKDVPSPVYGGSLFAEQPVINIVDSQGRLVTADSSTIVRATVITQTPPTVLWNIPSDLLLGTTEVTAVRGKATFTDLRITLCNDPASRSCSSYAYGRIRFATKLLSPTCAQFPERYPPVSPPCSPADSAALNVRVGVAAALKMLQQPAGASPGLAFSVPPIVVVADAGGNIVDNRPSSLQGLQVEVRLIQGTSADGKFLSGEQMVGQRIASAVSGSSPVPNFRFQFTDLGVRAASSFRLFFNATSVTNPPLAAVASSVFSIVVGEAKSLVIQSHPGSSSGGIGLSQQPLIHVVDAGGNKVSDTLDWMSVTASTLAGGNEKAPDIYWGGEVQVVEGSAQYTVLAVAQQAACVQLVFKSCVPGNVFDCPYLSPPSLPITVLIGQAAKIQVITEPGPVQQAGLRLSTQPQVYIQDRGGNIVPNAQETIRASIECRTTIVNSATSSSISPMCTFLSDHVDSSGTVLLQSPYPVPAEPVLPALLGLVTGVSQGGYLRFTDLVVARSGGPYRLRFARVAGFLDEGVTSTFSVVSGRASRLFIKQQPAVSPITGWILQPQPIVLLLDVGGNLVTDDSEARSVHVLLLKHGYPVFDTMCEPQQQPRCSPAPRSPGPALLSKTGVVSFTSLRINLVGQGYTLVFCDGPCPSRKTIYHTSSDGPISSFQATSAPPAAASGAVTTSSHVSPAPGLGWIESWPPLSVSAGAPYKVVLWRKLGGCVARLPCKEQPVVVIQDRGSNTLTDLPDTDVAASIFEADGTVSTEYRLAGFGSSAAAANQPPSSIRDLVVTTRQGRADFSDVLVNKATVGGKTLSIAFAASTYNVAFQAGLEVSELPSQLLWQQEAPATSAAGIAWAPAAQPVIIIGDASGLRVKADSSTQVTVQVVAPANTLAAGHIEGKGPRKATDVILGNTVSKCCRGRCVFTDLSIALAGSGYQLRVSTDFALLHPSLPATAAIKGVSVTSQAFVMTGCYGPVTCNKRGVCRGSSAQFSGTRRAKRRQVAIDVVDVPHDETGGECDCQRGYFGLACQKTASVRGSETVAITAAAPGSKPVEVSLGGGEGLSIPPGSISAHLLPLDVSADLLDELSLPPDMLPSSTDTFAPAGSFADFRPDGLQLAAPIDVALGYHTAQSGSKRLFIFTYNTTARAWQRLTAHASIVDENSRLVRTKLEHFSLYGVMLEEMGFTPAPTPTPPPPLPPPPPPSILLPIVYSLIGLVFGVLVCGGAVWQVMRFRERQRLRAVALEEAEKKRLLACVKACRMPARTPRAPNLFHCVS